MPHPTQAPSVQTYASATEFLKRMGPLLLEDEARYGLMLGIALTVASQPEFYSESAPYFAIAEDGNGVAAAALMTPPHGLIVYSERAECRPGLTAIAQNLASAGWSLPSVNGPEPVCTHFAAIWAETAGVQSTVGVRERVFELREVIHPTYSPGHLRQATMDDLDLLVRWIIDFSNEALHGLETLEETETRRRVGARLEQGAYYLWEDGEAVSFAGTTRKTAHGISIGPVYTPPQFRRKGYASSCVAKLSQLMLDHGRTFCTLFIDLSNPTSNHIYQNIGYRPVCDYTVYTFSTRVIANEENRAVKRARDRQRHHRS